MLIAFEAAAATTASRVHDELMEFLRSRAPRETSAIELPGLKSFEFGGVDPNGVSVELSTRHSRPLVGRVPVTVEMKSAGRLLKRAVVTARVRASRRVTTVARPLRRGAVVTRDDVRAADRDISELRGYENPGTGDLVGRRTTRSLAEGAIWRSDFVESMPVVKRGEVVRLRYDVGLLRIDGVGVARQDGRPGETISVGSRESRRSLSGRVDDQGVVHVGF